LTDIELIKNNAAIGSKIACALSAQEKPTTTAIKSIAEARRVTIVGGAAVDIISQSDTIVPGSSNSHVGHIMMNEGGSTRNVAECLGRLGLGKDVTFVSGIGDDDKQIFVKNSLDRVGISTDGLCVKQGERTAAFTGVLDKNGDFFCGVADMAVLEYIPREHLDMFKFWNSQVLILDSNIGTETLEYLLSRSAHVQHVIYEPISQEKSERILSKDFLGQLTCFKPNMIQL